MTSKIFPPEMMRLDEWRFWDKKTVRVDERATSIEFFASARDESLNTNMRLPLLLPAPQEMAIYSVGVRAVPDLGGLGGGNRWVLENGVLQLNIADRRVYETPVSLMPVYLDAIYSPWLCFSCAQVASGVVCPNCSKERDMVALDAESAMAASNGIRIHRFLHQTEMLLSGQTLRLRLDVPPVPIHLIDECFGLASISVFVDGLLLRPVQ